MQYVQSSSANTVLVTLPCGCRIECMVAADAAPMTAFQDVHPASGISLCAGLVLLALSRRLRARESRIPTATKRWHGSASR